MSNNEFDGKTMLSFVVETAKIVDLYGPVFQKMTAQYAVRFLAEKIGDPNPPVIDNIDNCSKYINQNLGKYPNGIAALAYGMGKAQNVLEGKIASGGRSVLRDGMKAFLEKTGMASIYGASKNTTEVFKNQVNVQKGMRLLVGDVTIVGDENSTSFTYKGCRFGDSCKAMAKEGIKRADGSTECSNARGHQAVVEYVTKTPYDFQVTKYDPPNCIFRIFKP
jgi:hypothetical protein